MTQKRLTKILKQRDCIPNYFILISAWYGTTTVPPRVSEKNNLGKRTDRETDNKVIIKGYVFSRDGLVLANEILVNMYFLTSWCDEVIISFFCLTLLAFRVIKLRLIDFNSKFFSKLKQNNELCAKPVGNFVRLQAHRPRSNHYVRTRWWRLSNRSKTRCGRDVK